MESDEFPAFTVIYHDQILTILYTKQYVLVQYSHVLTNDTSVHSGTDGLKAFAVTRKCENSRNWKASRVNSDLSDSPVKDSLTGLNSETSQPIYSATDII